MLIDINEIEQFAVFVLFREMIVYSRTRLLLARYKGYLSARESVI